jgi:hypothetical protein
VELSVPTCEQSNEFLVQAVYVGPEVESGATSIEVVNLPKWAVSVPVYQQYNTGVQIKVSLTALGDGPEHVSAKLPAGQSILSNSSNLIVRIILLGGSPASHRFEFKVHVTGFHGKAFISSP